MIDIENVCKNYGDKRVIDRISLQVKEGQTLVLLGTSGSGKTTLLKMINYLIAPTSGSIRIDGRNIANSDVVQLRRGIGYVIQQVGLFPHYTNRANIELTLELNNWSEPKKLARSNELLKLVGLSEADGDRFPHELSGGQQQRIGIARAMANNPSIILMDEPFGALDPITKQNLIEELTAKKLFEDKTVIMVTHDVYEAISLADTICLLDQGQVQQIGSPKELLFQPASKFVREFFDAQRLRLELQIVSLSEIFNHIENKLKEINSKAEISPKKSIWETLEFIDRENLSAITINNGPKNSKLSTASAILNAFYQYKETQITHSNE